MTIKNLKYQNLILFEAISGSRAFGLATENSDTDIRGVYYLPKQDFFGLNYTPQISNETNDITYYEIGRFVELLQKNNPNILEVLATPADCVQHKHPLMDLLKPENFISKLCKDTFAGYAISQIKKAKGLNKKILNPVDKERKSILDFCYILKNQGSVPLKKWLQEFPSSGGVSKGRGGLLQEKCGLVNIDNTKGMFALFYDESGEFGYKVLFNVKKPISFSFHQSRKMKSLLLIYFVTLMPTPPTAKIIANTGSGFPSVTKTGITLTNSMDKTMTVKT